MGAEVGFALSGLSSAFLRLMRKVDGLLSDMNVHGRLSAGISTEEDPVPLSEAGENVKKFQFQQILRKMFYSKPTRSLIPCTLVSLIGLTGAKKQRRAMLPLDMQQCRWYRRCRLDFMHSTEKSSSMRKHPARKIIGIFALTGFLVVTMFWWTGMHEGEGHMCIAATIRGAVCPNTTTSDAITFHANTLRSLIAGVFQPGQMLTLLLLLVVFSLAALLSAAGGGAYRTNIQSRKDQDIAVRRGRHRWLSLLEHSPSVI